MIREFRHVVIIGQMAVGKTTTARALARRLGRDHCDSDAAIEDLTGRTGRQIAATDGVDALHRLEAQVLLEALNVDEPLVVSAAASTIEDPRCRSRMAERAYVVVLTARVETLQERARAGAHRRDIPLDRLRTLVAERAEWFKAIADLTISAEQPQEKVVAGIAVAWHRAQPGPR